MSKRIAIPASKSKNQFFINQAYIEYLTQAGYEVVIVTPSSSIHDTVASCFGLVLPGGIDIDPIYYGEDNICCQGSDPEKDDFERKLFYSFLNQNKPIFGICRGFQLIMRELIVNKIPGYKSFCFYQNLNRHKNVDELGIARTIPSHSVTAAVGTLYGVEELYSSIFVNSMHHQAVIIKVERKTNPLVQVGQIFPLAVTKIGLTSNISNEEIKKKTKEAFVVEALGASINNTKIRAVQWHPEELRDIALLQNFFGEKEEKLIVGK